MLIRLVLHDIDSRHTPVRSRMAALALMLAAAFTASPARADDSAAYTPLTGEIWTPTTLTQDTPCDDCPTNVWPRFVYYVKGGPTLPLGDGFFSDGVSVGYQIAGGVRQPILPGHESVFLDFGGSFLSAQGSDRTITVSGDIANRTGVPLAVRQSFMNLTLSEIRRAGAQAAVGWYAYQDYRQECDGVIRSVVSARIGGRLSHIHSVYEQRPTALLQQYINANNLQNAELVKSDGIANDTALGIFGGCEMSFSRPIANAAELSFLVDTELANDWIDLENYKQAGLPTASFMIGLAISR